MRVTAAEPLISVVIPALNEAKSLGNVIAAARSDSVSYEILVVDAGSSDETTAITLDAGANLVHSRRRQRAHQLNLGAQSARGTVLLFLHADTLLPRNGLFLISRALQDRRVEGGAFARRYDSTSPVLRATCLLARCRNQMIGWHLGDQAMFLRAATFSQLGGFREVDQFEDLDFSRRLRKFGSTVTLYPCVTSSSRRFDRLQLLRQKIERPIVPWCTYTEPEVAHVGLGEKEAGERGISYDLFVVPMEEVDRAVVEDEEIGFAKILTAKGSDKILGATIVAPHAGDLVQELVLAMNVGIGLGKIATIIHAYPTFAELARKAGDKYNKTRLTPFAKKLFAWLYRRARS